MTERLFGHVSNASAVAEAYMRAWEIDISVELSLGLRLHSYRVYCLSVSAVHRLPT